MLESAVGAVGYVIRKLNQVRENVLPSQSRFEAIEIIEAIILALVAVATAWSGYQAARWNGNRAEQYAKASLLRVTAEGLATLADRSGSTTATPSTVGSPPSWIARTRRRSS